MLAAASTKSPGARHPWQRRVPLQRGAKRWQRCGPCGGGWIAPVPAESRLPCGQRGLAGSCPVPLPARPSLRNPAGERLAPRQALLLGRTGRAWSLVQPRRASPARHRGKMLSGARPLVVGRSRGRSRAASRRCFGSLARLRGAGECLLKIRRERAVTTLLHGVIVRKRRVAVDQRRQVCECHGVRERARARLPQRAPGSRGHSFPGAPLCVPGRAVIF